MNFSSKAQAQAQAQAHASPANDSVGEATMISYSVFASLAEVREAPAAQESAPATATSPAESAPPDAARPDAFRPEAFRPDTARAATAPESGAAADSLQAQLNRYADWLRNFNR